MIEENNSQPASQPAKPKRKFLKWFLGSIAGIVGLVGLIVIAVFIWMVVAPSPEESESSAVISEESEAKKQKENSSLSAEDQALLKSGQWRDPATNLIWTICSLGQTWNGTVCDGEAKDMTWWQAHAEALKHNEAGHNDWRLPTAPELASLMACEVKQGKSAFIAEAIADETDKVLAAAVAEDDWNNKDVAEQNDYKQNYFYSGCEGYVTTNLDNMNIYWSSSPYVGNSNYAWYVNFYYGYVYGSGRYGSYPVRLVRASQSLAGGNAALLAFEEQAKNIYRDPSYLDWKIDNAAQAKVLEAAAAE